jgi:hypothetical protein
MYDFRRESDSNVICRNREANMPDQGKRIKISLFSNIYWIRHGESIGFSRLTAIQGVKNSENTGGFNASALYA